MFGICSILDAKMSDHKDRGATGDGSNPPKFIMLDKMFIYTALLTLAMPIIMTIPFILKKRLDNIFYHTASVFIVSLFVYHCFIKRNEKKNTVDYLKSLDYIYLGVGALGLLSTADIARSEVARKYKESTELAWKITSEILDRSLSNMKHYCKDTNNINQCTIEIIYFRTMIQKLPPNNNNIDDYKYLVRYIHSREIADYRSLKHYSNVESAIKLSNIISSTPNPDYLFFPQIPKNIGYLLLASGLALRLTRVTAEVCKWHK